MITDYPSLQLAIAQWMPRPELAAQIPVAIAMAEAQINRSMRNRQQELRATNTVTEYLAFPTDYTEIRDIQLNTGGRHKTLELLSPSELDRRYGSYTGEPVGYCLIANQIQFGPAPSGTYTCEIVYYQKVPALTGSNTTNWFLTANPDAYVMGAKAYLLLGTPESQPFMQAFSTILEEINKAERKQRWRGPPSASRPA